MRRGDPASVGNLPTDVDPDELVEIIEVHRESLTTTATRRTQMAVFDPRARS